MGLQKENFSRYLPTDEQAREWGWRLVDGGRQFAAPGAKYPNQEHPSNYLFDKEGRRILDEFQVVFIERGSGDFESRSQPSVKVSEGDAFLLFPNEWHHYQPNPQTGWTEHWIGFRGKEATRIMNAFFSKERPIYKMGQNEALLAHFNQIQGWLEKSIGAKEQILASHVPLVLALLKSGETTEGRALDRDSRLVAQTKDAMLSAHGARVDLEELAARLGVSYSQFRFTFKKQTGYSPRAFENRIKLNRAREMLVRERLSVSETANALGYSSVYYFSRAFKARFGLSPRHWIREHLK